MSAVLALAACGEGSGDATIGGSINGLSSGLTVTLQNNALDTVTIAGTSASSLSFAFSQTLDASSTYSVTVLTQPLGQTCVILNGSGTVDSLGDDVDSVTVNCSTTSSVVGTVTGLNAGVAVSLTSNGSTLLLGNGSFAFPGVLVAGTVYNVTIAQQPSGQTCTLANGSGTVVANKSAVVNVSCS